MSKNTKLICLFLKAQEVDKLSDRGYAMAVVSVVTLIMFSMLSSALILSDLNKSRTNAIIDGSSAFYVAEAGLNKRAAEIDKKLRIYSGIRGATPASSDCFGVAVPTSGNGQSTRSGNNDFECVNYRFSSSNNAARVVDANGNISLNSNGQDANTYVAYTFVKDATKYQADGTIQYNRIGTGEEFAGLNAADYKYEVSAVGKKPVALPAGATVPSYTDDELAAKNRENTGATAETGDSTLIASYNSKTTAYKALTAAQSATTAAQDSSNNTTLSMTFTNRLIPLFQFGIFYNGDLELNPSADMQINGWVHSNANMYLQPAGIPTATTKPTTTFLSNVTAAGEIYNRVDAWVDGVGRTGITRVLLTGSDCTVASNCQQIVDYSASFDTPLSDFSAFTGGKLKDSTGGSTILKTPSPSSARKRNYANDSIGEYFSKADIRLEMVPDRAMPFNFAAITTDGSGTCTTTKPAAGSDPAATYVDPEREKFSSLKCRIFTKGQLQSLRQPVLVLTDINSRGTTYIARERTTLGAPSTFTIQPGLNSINTTKTDAVKTKIMRALQVAIASTPQPIKLDSLDKVFSDGSSYISDTNLATFKSRFQTLIGNISELDGTDRANLMAASPNDIAALRNAWFLPAPIQQIRKSDTVATTSNPRNSGFYDGREERWITMLQTNLASLSVWNRDGVYVESDDYVNTDTPAQAYAKLTSAYSGSTGFATAFSNVTATTPTANLTSGLAFDRVTTFTKSSGAELYQVGSLQYLGLGSKDKTEGGLVFHATVNDDLDGSGGALVAANDITVDTSDNTQRILKKTTNPTTKAIVDETDKDGSVIVLDYLRKYPNQTASSQSPFGFAFNGGNFLPNGMMIASDQAIYLQGNFNNNDSSATLLNPTASNAVKYGSSAADANRLPAAIVADTITVLSNECVAPRTSTNPLGVAIGQLTCGIPPTLGGTAQPYNPVSSPIAINAAFLSNTQVSRGNLGNGRGFSLASTAKSYSGGVNNYIRLLEDWYNGGSPYALNYSGSLISLGAPTEYSGSYRPGGRDTSDATDKAYYNVPYRNIGYDQNFNDIAKLPPLTPKASYIRQNGFNRKY